MTCRSFCFSKALCSSVFWFRTFLPLKKRRNCGYGRWSRGAREATHIFWLNSSSLCRFWRSDDSKTGFLNFLGRTSPSSSRAMFDEIISAFMPSLCSNKSSSVSGGKTSKNQPPAIEGLSRAFKIFIALHNPRQQFFCFSNRRKS